jgi:hypothetical protein
MYSLINERQQDMVSSSRVETTREVKSGGISGEQSQGNQTSKKQKPMKKESNKNEKKRIRHSSEEEEQPQIRLCLSFRFFVTKEICLV